MIAKKFRLREYEVSRVFKKGRPFFSEFWSMHCLEARNASYHRMAVSISRKHDKRAVQRNRYRRGLYDGMLPLLRQSAKYYVGSIKADTVATNLNTKYVIPHTKMYQCVFTLKKGLTILERKIPQTWVDDAVKLFEKRK